MILEETEVEIISQAEVECLTKWTEEVIWKWTEVCQLVWVGICSIEWTVEYLVGWKGTYQEVQIEVSGRLMDQEIDRELSNPFSENFRERPSNLTGFKDNNRGMSTDFARMKAADSFSSSGGVKFGSFEGSSSQIQRSTGIDLDFRNNRGARENMTGNYGFGVGGPVQGPPRGTWSSSGRRY